MMRLAIVLALAVGALASGCYYQEDYTCVRKHAVKCGNDWCDGHCDVDFKKSCDVKVWFKTVCDKEDYCKKIETPCGNDGHDYNGLTCGYGEECIADKKCILVPAHKKKDYVGWKSRSMADGFFEVCKDEYACAKVDPWGLDADAIEVVCTKEYTIVDDMDCDSLFHEKKIWGGSHISEDRFFKMNAGFSCGEKLIGRVICVEAEVDYKIRSCGGHNCEYGYECATKEICREVAVEKPRCAKKPVYRCYGDGSRSGSYCGNHVCRSYEKCEIISNRVCPDFHGDSVRHGGRGARGGRVGGGRGRPGDVDPVVVVRPEERAPRGSRGSFASSSSASIATGDGTATKTNALSINGGDARAVGIADNGDALSLSKSRAKDGETFTKSDASVISDHQEAFAKADAEAFKDDR